MGSEMQKWPLWSSQYKEQKWILQKWASLWAPPSQGTRSALVIDNPRLLIYSQCAAWQERSRCIMRLWPAFLRKLSQGKKLDLLDQLLVLQSHLRPHVGWQTRDLICLSIGMQDILPLLSSWKSKGLAWAQGWVDAHSAEEPMILRGECCISKFWYLQTKRITMVQVHLSGGH